MSVVVLLFSIIVIIAIAVLELFKKLALYM